MSLRSSLRLVAQPQSRLEALCQKYIGSIIVETKSEGRYLQLRLHDSMGVSRDTFLNIDDWLQENTSILPDIPWHSVPLGYLSRWINNLEVCFFLENELWNVDHVKLPQKPIPEKLLSLPAAPGLLLGEDWPDKSVNFSMDKTMLFRVPFSLNYVLGRSQLSLSQISNISFGDLILIKNQMAYLSICHHKLFRISYLEGEEIVVNEKITVDDKHYHEEILHDWLELPVDIEFILDSKIVTLNEINNIRPGSKLSVTPSAEQAIKILLNKKIFAWGELVALENGTLAVEINKINPILDESREQSHD